MENLDVELFIDEVKDRPCLWDSSSEDYKNRQLKRDAWKEICQIAIPDFTEKTEKGMQEIGKAVQLKWKHLRDAFVRQRRQFKSKKSGAAAKTIKTYIYAKQLEFLRKVTDSCQTESSLPTTLQESQDDRDQSQDHNHTQDSQVDVSIETQTQAGPSLSRSTQFRRKKFALESKLMTYIDSQTKQSSVIQNQPKDTDDLAFFRSLQTSLDTLSPNEKLNFRIDVMQLLTRYTNKQPYQYTPNFRNLSPDCQQPTQYPFIANFPNTRFNTPMPSPGSTHTPYPTVSPGLLRTSYHTVSPGLTLSLRNNPESNTCSNDLESQVSPETQCSLVESEDSIMSQADSILSLL